MSMIVKGHGQLELNQVAFPRDGRIEAQLPLKTADFTKAGEVYGGTTAETDKPCEVGMVLVVDKANKCVRKAAAGEADANAMFALNYSTEHMYDERVPQLREYCMYAQPDYNIDYQTSFYDDFYPRMGFLAVGDRFTTNAVEDTTLSVGDTVGASTTGYWKKNSTLGPQAQVVAVTTMPDGQPAVKLMVVKA